MTQRIPPTLLRSRTAASCWSGLVSRADLWLPVALAAVAAATFLTAGIQPDGSWSVPFDDTWIHLAYGRTFLETGRWALSPLEPPSAGTTGHLWALLLAAGMQAGLSPELAAVLPGALAFPLLIAVWGALVRSSVDDRVMACAATAVPALSGNLLLLSVSGMEAVAFLLLAFAAVLAWHREAFKSYATAAAAVSSIRPEGVLVSASIALAELYRRRRAPRDALRSVARALAPALVGMALSATINLAVSGDPMPQTFQGRRWLESQPPGVDLSPAALATNAGTLGRKWAILLHDYIYTLAFSGPDGVGNGAALDARVGALLLLLFVIGLAGSPWWARGPLGVVFLHAILHNSAYLAFLPVPGAAGRYQPMNGLLASALPVLGAASVAAALRRRGHDGSRPLRALALALLVPAAFNARVWWQATHDVCAQLVTVHRSAALWIRDNLPADAHVGAFDIGALAMYGEHDIVEFAGLTSPESARALHAARTLEFLYRNGATHLAMIRHHGLSLKELLAEFGLYARRGEAFRGADMDLLMKFQVPGDALWHRYMTGNFASRIDIFRLRWRPEAR